MNVFINFFASNIRNYGSYNLLGFLFFLLFWGVILWKKLVAFDILFKFF